MTKFQFHGLRNRWNPFIMQPLRSSWLVVNHHTVVWNPVARGELEDFGQPQRRSMVPITPVFGTSARPPNRIQWGCLEAGPSRTLPRDSRRQPCPSRVDPRSPSSGTLVVRPSTVRRRSSAICSAAVLRAPRLL